MLIKSKKSQMLFVVEIIDIVIELFRLMKYFAGIQDFFEE
jgi:hypothetical protein